MPLQSSPLGSLSESAQLQKLKNAKIALWVAGVLQIAFNLFLFFNVQKELQDELNKQGVTETMLNRLGAEERKAYEDKKEEVISQAKMIYGSAVGIGALLIGCALMVNRKPVVATAVGLVLFVGFNAVLVSIDPDNLKRGIILKIFVIVSLISGLKAAIAYQNERKQGLS